MLQIGRYGHACARILKEPNQASLSVIAVGGRGASGDLRSVEYLEYDRADWKLGPELPVDVFGATLVEDGQGGVILVGGHSGLDYRVLYRLKHLGDIWTEMPQKLRIGRMSPVAFLIPDESCNCRKFHKVA